MESIETIEDDKCLFGLGITQSVTIYVTLFGDG